MPTKITDVPVTKTNDSHVETVRQLVSLMQRGDFTTIGLAFDPTMKVIEDLAGWIKQH